MWIKSEHGLTETAVVVALMWTSSSPGQRRAGQCLPTVVLKRPLVRHRPPPPAPWPGGPAWPAARSPPSGSPPWVPSSHPVTHCECNSKKILSVR